MASDSLPTPPSLTPTPAAAASSGSQQPADASSPATGQPVPPTTTAAGPPTPAEMLESLLQQIVASSSPPALAGTLRNAMATPEAREEILISTTTTGADPLEALDPAQHTIGALYVLYVLSFRTPHISAALCRLRGRLLRGSWGRC